MKKNLIIIIILIFTSLLLPENNIVESVDVDWWILPVFAVDKDDNSVLDLKDGDVEVLINGRIIKNFTIYKRDFNVENVKGSVKTARKAPLKKKIAFLIFDIAFTTLDNLNRSVSIARDLIAKGSDTTAFVIMIVDPYAGLQYKAGPETDKEVLYSIIDKEVKINERARSVQPAVTAISGAQISGKRGNKYDPAGMAFLSEEITSSLRNTNQNFYFSFESLYYSLNQITDNKFIYFFSEGLSFWSRKSSKHSEEQYFRSLKKAADMMGQSGSVIFVINPKGFDDSDISGGGFFSLQSGDDSLKYIASESGGRYLRGNKKDLSERFEKMNKAYYEIAFSDTGMPDGGIGEIEIRAKREGINIHSLKKIEKKKNYSQMKKIEKEVLALNLLGRNTLFKPPVQIRGFNVLSEVTENDNTYIKLKLPGNFKRKYVDLFIINTGEGVIDSVRMEKKLVPGDIVNISIPVKGSDTGKFVLIDEENNIAFVEGVIDFGERLIKELISKNNKFDKKVKKISEKDKKELKKTLLGAADYCERLENAAFHFICKEDIEEKLQFIRRARSVKRETYNPQTGVMIRTREPGSPNRKSRVQKFKQRFIYDYQLIIDKGKATEQRKIIKGKRKDKKGAAGSLRVESFLSKKIVLVPTSFLGIVNQGRYKFRFVKRDTIDKVKTDLIEVFPKKLDQTDSIYGKVWIDIEDNSILRIEVNPLSIGGLTSLMKLASDLGSILDVKCTINFGLKRNGIRFPTQVRIRELYHGGDFLKRVMRMPSWEKSRTTYRYRDYKFFEVDTEVELSK
ncbi:MAG: hypothetical protein ABFR36_09100 [Acidobacteriota bacterium]